MNNAKRPKPIKEPRACRIVVAAASARFQAASSIRARCPVSTIDLFADADTVSISRQSSRYLLPNQAENFAWHCQSIDEIHQRLEHLLSDRNFQDKFGPNIVLLGGGLEKCLGNDNLNSKKIMGPNDAEGTFKVLLWREIVASCRRNSIGFPISMRERDARCDQTQWLVKTEFSSGGMGVRFAQSQTLLEADEYFQEYIEGKSISACYVATPAVGSEGFPQVKMLGVCESVSTLDPASQIPMPEAPSPFRYQGSVGPLHCWRLPKAMLAEVERVGRLIANDFKLVGVFGIDFVWSKDRLWLLEVNPRITASAELIERSARETMLDFSIVHLHLDALLGRLSPKSSSIAVCQSVNQPKRMFAKRIVYRQHDSVQSLKVTTTQLDAMESKFGQFFDGCQLPRAVPSMFITDVPKPETSVVAGNPILTLHVSGDSHPEIQQRLTRGVAMLEEIFAERLA